MTLAWAQCSGAGKMGRRLSPEPSASADAEALLDGPVFRFVAVDNYRAAPQIENAIKGGPLGAGPPSTRPGEVATPHAVRHERADSARLKAPPSSSAGVTAVMRANRSKDTRPEMAIRSALHRRGLRSASTPGRSEASRIERTSSSASAWR